MQTSIRDYWQQRAESFSDYNRSEMADERLIRWSYTLQENIHRFAPDRPHEAIRILDVGTGPGFFAIILARCGYQVTAVDFSDEMLKKARENAAELADAIVWKQADAMALPFDDGSFDVVVSRDVTWNLPDPGAAYKEWSRVLCSDGVLLNFDANWYTYLYDDEKKAAFRQDRVNTAALDLEDCNVGENFDVCEELAKDMPLSRILRPAWDKAVLETVGFSEVRVDENVWKLVWSEDEKVSCASTPLFLIIGLKRACKDRIVAYWTKRSQDFLDLKRRELHESIGGRWLDEIRKYLPDRRPLTILDVGCGTGFFSILLAKEGHMVTGIDLTPDMISCARTLALEEDVSCVFEIGDAEDPAFRDETFDVVISRNLTWTLPNIDTAYKNWVRVLKKGGVLINFDANYGLEETEAMDDLPTEHAHNALSRETLRENDLIKRQLDISYHSRPARDFQLLSRVGCERFSIDTGISKRIYLEKDEFYNPTPMFVVSVVKD